MCYKAQTERGKKREKFTEKENYLKFCSSPIVLFSNLVSIDARVFSVVLCGQLDGHIFGQASA